VPRFRYSARNQRGDLVVSHTDGASSYAVANQLKSEGLVPIEIVQDELPVDPLLNLKRRLTRKPPTLDDLILFCRQMYTLNKAGVPIIRGIAGLAETTINPVLAETLSKIRLDLEAGRELSSAMSQYRDIFSTIIISMVRVGENTGQLDDAFLQLSRYLELDRDTRARISSATRYPSFVVMAIVAAIFVVNIWVIPAFAGVFQGMKMDLPWQTRALLTMSDFFVVWWRELLVVLVGGFFAANWFLNTPRGRMLWAEKKLKLPIMGSIINRATLGRFARTFAMASRSGVPLLQTLNVVSQSVDNDYIAERVIAMRNGIERGDTLTRTVVASKLFTPLVIQMIAVGEETGAVDTMLEEVADFYEREVDYELKNISSAIEPILIVAIGALVLMLALGIFLPMWEMTSMASQG
jgi:MSHA biogenesis protein MshG